MLFFSKIERAETKLKIMAFMESFEEDFNALQPQLNTVIAAAGSLRASVKLRKIFEVVLGEFFLLLFFLFFAPFGLG